VVVQLLSDRRLERDACRALEQLTGKDFGDDRSAWMRWWTGRSAATTESGVPGEK